MSNTASNILVQKLDAFIRKYYQNQLIKGSIFFTGIFVLAFLMVSMLEYFGRYTTQIRAILFYSVCTLALFCLAKYILIPLARLFKLGKQINHIQAAHIIGKHFKGVSDKLLNTLQLMNNSGDEALLVAAIEQKTTELKPVAFGSAIDFKKNLKYARYALFPVLSLLVILLIAPGMISDGAKRVMQYNKTFKVPAPFTFMLENTELKAEQYNDYELRVKVSGKELPNEVVINYQNQSYKLQKTDPTHFTFIFKNLQKNTPFQLQANEFYSDAYTLEVLAKPIMIGYAVYLDYPSYINQKDAAVNNPGDLNIPAGTVVKWQFTSKQTDEVWLEFNKVKVKADTKNNINYSYSRKFFLSDAYSIKMSNSYVKKGDSLHFEIAVIPDAFPQIIIDERKDSFSDKIIYFGGEINDDYGLSKLAFNYRYLKSALPNKTDKGIQTTILPIGSERTQTLNHVFNLYEINFESEDEIEYYFEVWDNDGVHGHKSTRSKTFTIKAPGKQELKEQASANSQAMQEKMEQTLKEAKDLQKDLNEMQRKMKNSDQLTWEEKKKIEKLLQRQKELTKKIDELQKDYKQKNLREKEFKEEEQKIVEKQDQLQKMYEELMTDEMKKLMKEMEDMMKLQNKDLLKNELDKLQLNNKDVEKELDRMLEMYKQFEVEKKMEDAMKQLGELSKKQEELSKDTKDKKQNKEELTKRQEELNKEFKDLKTDLKEVEKKNSELENPKELENTEKQQESIDKKMQKSKEELDKDNNKDASESQKDAAKEMKEMEDKMRDKQASTDQEEEEIDINALREILENLVQLSKDQEDLMERLKAINGYNPQFVKLAQEQKTVSDNAKMVEDSLFSLSKRVPAIKSFINREVTKMNSHLDKSNQGFSQRNIGETRTQQQYGMTRMNNLAVMLSDALKQMQQQAQEKKDGASKGKGKPSKGKGKGKGGKPSMGQLKKMQEEMNKQMREGMNKNGTEKGKGGKGGMGSEEFARMAAQQMAIRQQMQRMISQMDGLEKQKLGGGQQLGDLQKMMEQTEKELVNKRLTQETLMRQQEILTRLLEHEKAEKKQEQDNKREAGQAREIPRPSPQYLEEINKKKQKETEFLRTVPVEMQPYYKQKAKEYLEKVQ
ncbi:MAG: DUF4175 domain-containing protein [Bacteroidia bacterium]|nr:DUF4175 domain-containing protein [Bacteroidia bacterium]